MLANPPTQPKGRLRQKSYMNMTTLLALQRVNSKHMARDNPQWDTDSGVVGIDNRCSKCKSHEATDFIGELTDSNRTIKGFGGDKTIQCQTWYNQMALGR